MYSRRLRLDALACLLERFPRGPFSGVSTLFFRDIYWCFDECQLDLTTETLGSRAVAVGLGRPMVFWKAKDLIRNTAEGRQVQRPYMSQKWPCPREATIFCVLPSKIAADEWDKVVVNFRQKYLRLLVFRPFGTFTLRRIRLERRVLPPRATIVINWWWWWFFLCI